MYLTQTNVIRGLSKSEYKLIGEMCRYANSLYNVGLYSVRQYYFATRSYLSYESNYHECKENENYKMLQAGIAQQILRVVDRSFKSFFGLISKAKDGDYRFRDIELPHYKAKGGMFPLILQKNSIAIKDGKMTLPMSYGFKKKHSCDKIRIPFPRRLDDKNLKEIHILPICNGKAFKIQFVYEVPDEDLQLNKDNCLGIDLGIDNLAACVPTKGTPFLMDGRNIKSINHRWNKEKARLQSVADKQGFKGCTNRIFRITEKRNNQVKDCIRKTARYIINYCIKNDIGTIVVGYNKDFKKSVEMGKRNNQTFVQIPLGNLRWQLKYLCALYGMDYVEQEESYTSKSSFLDNDVLPSYTPESPYQGKFSGKRIKRGLYKSANGTLLNADINGAANILRKASRWSKDLLCPGFLDNPQRIRVSNDSCFQTSLESTRL